MMRLGQLHKSSKLEKNAIAVREKETQYKSIHYDKFICITNFPLISQFNFKERSLLNIKLQLCKIQKNMNYASIMKHIIALLNIFPFTQFDFFSDESLIILYQYTIINIFLK